MKKISMLLFLGAIVLTSCGRSGWNCKNRYCKAPEKGNKIEKNQTAPKANV